MPDLDVLKTMESNLERELFDLRKDIYGDQPEPETCQECGPLQYEIVALKAELVHRIVSGFLIMKRQFNECMHELNQGGHDEAAEILKKHLD